MSREDENNETKMRKIGGKRKEQKEEEKNQKIQEKIIEKKNKFMIILYIYE